jgi:tRNA (guanine37-N1)-methyltransferase
MGPSLLLFESLPVRVDHNSNSDNNAMPTILPLSAFPDKRLFDETVDYPVISVATRDTAIAKQRLRDWIPTKRKVIFPDNGNGNDNRRKIVLMPHVSMADVTARMAESAIGAAVDEPEVASRSALPAEEEDQPNGPSSGNKAKTEKQQKKKKHKEASSRTGSAIEFTIPTTEPTMRLIRTYDDQSTDEILRKLLLPSDTIREIPSAVEQVGHIAHLNLREELLPYQHWIGQILLDKHTCLKTVVNKTSSIATIYRTFPMTVIAGDDQPGWSVTTVHEHNCLFRLDYQTVYWNSRLSHEHERLVHEIVKTHGNQAVVADCMAGVGPFAIPLAKRGITVHANDLNEESVKYLNMNIKLNKIPEGQSSLVHVYNQDARQFIKEVFAAQPSIDCAILNLPASAPEFLDAFADDISPNVHLYVYSFAPKNDPNQAVERCRAALGEGRQQDLLDLAIHTVRDVSPGKNMYCISFRLSNKKVKTNAAALLNE